MKDLYLSEYMPRSELVVEKHFVETPRFPVVDMHSHFGQILLGEDYANKYDTGEVVERLKKNGVRKTVNLDGFSGTVLDKMLKKIHPYEGFILTFGSIDVTRLDEPGFAEYVRATIRESKEKGIKGLKFWKDISLNYRDKNGKYISIDDPRLQVIWTTAAEINLPVLIHIADPVAFFKPADRFNERYEELKVFPEWSCGRPGQFTFEELITMQENLLAGNPETIFIVAHGGSYSENLKYVGESLDRFPNMYIDIAARIGEFGRQPYTARKFFYRYQDRILFGTDASPLALNYPVYYRFLETWDEYFDYIPDSCPVPGRWKIYGLGLEDEVLKKIYYQNAEKIL